MPYIERENGKIVRVVRKQPNCETIDENSQEWIDYQSELAQKEVDDGLLQDFTRTDYQMPRVTEDLVNTLIRKGVIVKSDLPQDTQDILLDRDKKREKLKP